MLLDIPRAFWQSYLHRGLRGRTHLHCNIDAHGCGSCGSKEFEQLQVISDELASAWGLSPRERLWFDQREGHLCCACHMSRRVRMLLWSLRQKFPRLDSLRVLHLNRINHLRPALIGVSSLVETLHLPTVALGRTIDGYSNQDFTRLTFPDDSFDLVIHSETLEHVFQPELALAEAHRVLKPGGCQFYTVPLLHRRKTLQRAALGADGQTCHLLAPSYHGLEGEDLVVWEFGGDFFRRRGQHLTAVYYDDFHQNSTVFAFVEGKDQPST